MYEKNADIMESLKNAKNSVADGAMGLLKKLKGSSQNDIDNAVSSQLPPNIAAGINSVNDAVRSQLPSDVGQIVDDLRSQTGGQLADKATKLLGEGGRLVGDKVEKSNAPSALSYIPGIGGYLGGLAKPTPGRGRFVSSVGEGVSGNIGGVAGGAAGVAGGATLGGVGALLAALLSKGKIRLGNNAILGGGLAGGITGNSLGTHAGAGLFRDIAAKPEKSAELTGSQEELDVNDNGKIEAVDLAALRKGKKPSKDKPKIAEWTPAPTFSANMTLPEKKPNPFVQGKKTAPKADASGAEAALAKLGSQDNASPSRSAAGDSKGVKYKQQNDDHATGTAAFDSLDKYLRMSKKAGLNNFQSNFFGRLIQEGRNSQEIYAAVKQAQDQFGSKVGKELKKGLEKLALMGVLSGIGKGVAALGRGIGAGARGAYTGAKAGINASSAGKSLGQAGTAFGEAGQAARLAGQDAFSAIGTGLSDAGNAIRNTGGYRAVKGAITSLPAIQQGLGNAASTAGNFITNNANTIGALGAGGGIAYGASQIPGAVQRGVNTAVNAGIDRGMDRIENRMQQMPGQIKSMANQAMQNLPAQFGNMANQTMQRMPFVGGGQATGGFAGPYKQSSEKWAARNSIFTDTGRFSGLSSSTEDMLNRAGPYGPELEAAVGKLKGKDFKGLLGKEIFRDIPYNVMQSRNPIGLEAMTAAQNTVDRKVLERAIGMTSMPKQVFNTLRDSPVTKRILATVTGLLKKHPLGAALGAGAAGGMVSGAGGAGVANLIGLGKESSEKRAWAGLISGAKAALPSIGKYLGISGGVPGAAAKGIFDAARGTGATVRGAASQVLKDPRLKSQMYTGAGTGFLNPFTGFGRGDEDEGLGATALRLGGSTLAGATGGLLGGKGTQDVMRRMFAGNTIGTIGDMGATALGYDTGGMGAKGGFLGAGMLPAKLPNALGLAKTPGVRGSTTKALEYLDPFNRIQDAAIAGYGKVAPSIRPAYDAAKNAIKTNKGIAVGGGLGAAGLGTGTYIGNRALSKLDKLTGDINQQARMFRQETSDNLNNLGGMGGIGQFFNENKHWLMPALLAGGGALTGNAFGGNTGAVLGGLSLPALYMMHQNGMFGGGGGAANPLQAPEGKPRLDYAQQNQQRAREEADKQVAARTRDPRLAPKGIFAGSNGPNMSHLAL